MLQIGAASRVINNAIGRQVQGASVDNVAEYVRDNCEANALYLSDGATSVLLVSCDVAGIEPPYVRQACAAMGRAAGIPERNIIIAGTHMHSGPSLVRTNYFKPLDSEYLDRLQAWLVELAQAAVAGARPGRMGWGLGQAQIGYNRRCCWADGSHTMHGDVTRPDFTGLEGPDDPRHLALFALDTDGKLIAVAYNATSHPTAFYGARFYSADFPGAAREYLRAVLGEIPVLYLNGAFGDQANENMLTKQHFPETREQRMMRAAHIVAGETLRLLHEATFQAEPPLAHVYADLEANVRLPDPQRVAWAQDLLRRVDAGEAVNPWERMLAYSVKLLQDEFGANPTDHLPVHALRIGDVALVTQPCELYCQYGLDIKRRSPAPLTGVVGIADGYAGYCPTTYGVLGGGYSGESSHWARLAPETGYLIVDTASRLLRQLWPQARG